MAELMDVKGNLKVYNTAGSEIWKSGPGRVLRVFSQILGKLGQNQKGQEILIVRRSRYIYIYMLSVPRYQNSKRFFIQNPTARVINLRPTGHVGVESSPFLQLDGSEPGRIITRIAERCLSRLCGC